MFFIYTLLFLLIEDQWTGMLIFGVMMLGMKCSKLLLSTKLQHGQKRPTYMFLIIGKPIIEYFLNHSKARAIISLDHIKNFFVAGVGQALLARPIATQAFALRPILQHTYFSNRDRAGVLSRL